MHWTDAFNDINKKAPHYSSAGLRLIHALRAEGWQPEDIEKLADPIFIDVRVALLQSLHLLSGKRRYGETHVERR